MNVSALRVLALAAALAGAGVSSAAALDVRHLHHLANFEGVVPYSEARVVTDRSRDEAYVLAENVVRVFNGAGMEAYSFLYDVQAGLLRDLAVLDDGDLMVLDARPATGAFGLVRCDFRGQPRYEIRLGGLPPEFAAITPDVLLRRGANLVLVSRRQMLAVEIDVDGSFQRGLDLGAALQIPPAERADNEIRGVAMGTEGELLLTIPTLFRAYVVTPDGTARAFGESGSGPGTFGVATAIEMDDSGHYFVADALRDVVLVFDRDLKFVSEFGNRGIQLHNLARPGSLARGRDGKLYVAQKRKRGIAVFKVGL